jgi:hypothetical protein
MGKLSVRFALVCSLLLIARSLPAQVQGGWVNTGNMNAARENATQVPLANGKVLVVGGTDGTNNLLASAEIYSSSTGVWTDTGSMATARGSFAAVLLKTGKVLVAGGADASRNPLASAELYDPSTGKWSPAGSLSVPRFGHSATLLQSGKVLVAGGCETNGCSLYASAGELYDPVANKWTTTGAMLTPRRSHTATLLNNGDVLVIGGTDGVALSSCELYNPSTGKWQSAPSITYGRFLHTATLLQSGKVLLAGGTSSRYPIIFAEVYDPTANAWNPTGSMIAVSEVWRLQGKARARSADFGLSEGVGQRGAIFGRRILARAEPENRYALVRRKSSLLENRGGEFGSDLNSCPQSRGGKD